MAHSGAASDADRLVGGEMSRLEWTVRERKPQAEIDELYGELLESIEIDGPYELETRYTLARVIGFACGYAGPWFGIRGP
jgi:hypothetical protein